MEELNNKGEQNYKKIEILLNKPLSNKELNVFNEIVRNYKGGGFYFEIPNKNILNFYLRSVNLEDLKNILGGAIKEYNASSRIFSQIIKEIEKIKSYGIKDGKRIYVGYDKERKVQNRKIKELQRGPYFYTRDHNFSRINNELPKEFENKIICGDSEEVLKGLPENCVDLIFTSPPYNFGLGYDITKDDIDWKKYFDKLFRIFSKCVKVLKYGGRIIVDIQPLFSDYIPTHHFISDFFIKNKLIWKGEIIWDKHNYNCKYTAWGSWKSPSSPYLKYTWEFLEIFAKGNLKKEGLKQNIDITAEEFKNWVVAKWSIAPEKDMKKYNHPAMFPEELARRVIKLFSFKNDVVLDPFNGVGTTTVVAHQLKRRFLGIDISKEYCEKAVKRLHATLF